MSRNDNNIGDHHRAKRFRESSSSSSSSNYNSNLGGKERPALSSVTHIHTTFYCAGNTPEEYVKMFDSAMASSSQQKKHPSADKGNQTDPMKCCNFGGHSSGSAATSSSKKWKS